MNGRLHLADSLALAGVALRPYSSPPIQPDPLRLQLPPVGFGGGSTLPDANALRILAALYLYAELEQAGIIPVAEVLAGARDTLDIRSDTVAARLDAFAHKAPEWYDRDHRNTLFARVFGLGAGASNDQGTLVNRDFQRALGAFCLALLASAGATGWPNVSPVQDAHLLQTTLDLLTNLGSRVFGNSLLAGQSIHEQFTRALEILNDTTLQSSFQAHGLWDFLHKIIGDPSPDFSRLLHRGQDGQRIIEWLASALPQFGRGPMRMLPISSQALVVAWAAGWLDATGMLPATASAGVFA